MVADKIKQQQIINENYLQSLKVFLKPLMDNIKPEDKRFEIAKVILQGIYSYGAEKHAGRYNYYEDIIRESIEMADDFMKEYEKKNNEKISKKY